jgi:hypothetical protein
MKQKTVNDFPEYVRIQTALEKLRAEKVEVSARFEQISWDLSQPKQKQVDGEQAWAQVLQGTDSYRYGVDTRSELRDEQIKLQDRLEFLDQVLSTGEMELDRIVGRCSLEICQGIRKEWVAHVGRVLEHLKGLCDGNTALDKMRADLEAQGVRTGSLPYAKFDIGTWSDPYGGKVVGHQRFIAEHYPELTAAAGMAIKAKLAAIAKREQAFEERGASE